MLDNAGPWCMTSFHNLSLVFFSQGSRLGVVIFSLTRPISLLLMGGFPFDSDESPPTQTHPLVNWGLFIQGCHCKQKPKEPQTLLLFPLNKKRTPNHSFFWGFPFQTKEKDPPNFGGPQTCLFGAGGGVRLNSPIEHLAAELPGARSHGPCETARQQGVHRHVDDRHALADLRSESGGHEPSASGSGSGGSANFWRPGFASGDGWRWVWEATKLKNLAVQWIWISTTKPQSAKCKMPPNNHGIPKMVALLLASTTPSKPWAINSTRFEVLWEAQAQLPQGPTA